MGCDGGTIPTRDELVRLKRKPEQKDKDAERTALWQTCSIKQEALVEPIMACEIGRLYNKESIIEYLLDKSRFEGTANFDHIRGLKDVKELKLSPNPAYTSRDNEKGDGYVDRNIAPYVCPISGIEMNGKQSFCYLLPCCCVVALLAMKEVKSSKCLKCDTPYVGDDIIIINGTSDEQEDLTKRMKIRRQQAKLKKKAEKKHKLKISSENSEADSSKKFKSLTNSSKASSSKITASKTPTDPTAKYKNIQENPNASKAYKSLFTTSEACKNQPKAHWVTTNPLYY